MLTLACAPAILALEGWGGAILAAVVVAGLGVSLVVSGRRARRGARRGHLEARGPWWWRVTMRRELRRIAEQWEDIAELAGIAGARLMQVTADHEAGWSIRVSAPGCLAIDIDMLRLHSATATAIRAGVPDSSLEAVACSPSIARPIAEPPA